jgi:L-ascorbate metabolism protein UlaG (beta-lactamase superfamily)
MKLRRLSTIPLMLILLVTAGCAQATPVPPTPTPTTPPAAATLEYIGHACFVLTASDGTRIAMDPYNSYSAPAEIQKFPDGITANMVTISHFHPDHSNIKGIGGKPRAMYQPGTDAAGIIQIAGLTGDHGLVNNVPTGANTVFVFTIGDIKIVHMGGQGMITEPEILAAIENADVVMIDANGTITNPVPEMVAQLREHKVRTIIPDHYSFTEKTKYYGSITLDEMIPSLPASEKVVRESGSTLTVTAGMPVQFLVLTPSALASQ